ncbi:MAG: imidazole glycerol phosphate synthase subunit HisH [Actinomycetota bacterium]|nr:imidazole glycerol phosphate synthase subunit HisH [Actinomycetota bacterium]
MYIAIINYDMGNIRSVENAFKKIGADVRVTGDPEVINNSGAVVLPGVGAFGDAYKNLKSMGLIKIIKENLKKKFFLGICLGMQLLFEYSLEDGKNMGLGILKGYVEKIPSLAKIPHIGWNRLNIAKDSRLFSGMKEEEHFYFVHSYYVVPEDKNIVNCTTDYGAILTAGIECGKIYGLQFHPEKSSAGGLNILENFWNMAVKESQS